MARLLRTNGGVDVLDVPARGLTLPQLHAFVGGYIEIVALEAPSARYAALVVNDDGLREQLPINLRATALYRASLARPTPRDVIVGDAVLVEVVDAGQDTERIL